MNRDLTEAEYQALANLFHEFTEAFRALPYEILHLYYKRLYQGKPK